MTHFISLLDTWPP